MEGETSLRKICLYIVSFIIKTFGLVHPERRWKTYEWKKNYVLLLDEILMAFNKLLCHIEILKPEILSKHHHACLDIFY